jgi:hypothetical protein
MMGGVTSLYGAAAGPAGPGAAPRRHPADPEPATSSKALAVLALGIVGVVLMLCGGGLVPGVVGLVLARPARAEIGASGGFLTGGRPLRIGEVLSWVAVAVSAVVIALVVVGLLLGSVDGGSPHYGTNVN